MADGHINGIGDQLACLIGVNRPPNNPSGMSIKNCGAVNLAFSSGMLGDIGNPELIGAGSTKVTIDEVASGSNVGFLPILAFGGKTVDSIAGHDLFHRWFGYLDSKAHGEFGMNAPRPVGVA